MLDYVEINPEEVMNVAMWDLDYEMETRAAEERIKQHFQEIEDGIGEGQTF